MHGTRVWLRALPAIAVLAGSVALAAPASATRPAACRLLDSPVVRQSVSLAGELELKVRCGLIARPASPGTTAPSRPTSPLFGPDVLVNDRSTDTWTHITQSETTLAVNGSTLLAGFNDSGQFMVNGDFTGYARSINGGASWTDLGAPTTPLGAVAAVFGDPVLVADRNRVPADAGVFYFANIGQTASGKGIVSVHKTTDAGTSWALAANASPNAKTSDFQDKPWIAVDTRSTGTGAGNVYACWTRFPAAGGTQIVFSRSTNGGVSYTQLAAPLATGASLQQCIPAVNPANGEVYVIWLDRTGDPRIIHFRKSTNQGASFGPDVVVASAPVAENNTSACGRQAFVDSEPGASSRAIRSSSFPNLGVNPKNGELYVTYPAAGLPGGSEADIGFTKSVNDGTTWSPPVRINSVATGQQFFSSIGVNGKGKIEVSYTTTQKSASDRLLDEAVVTSGNGGGSWSAPVIVSDVSFDRPVTNPNFDTLVAACYMGDYNTVATAAKGLGGATFFVIWGDNRLDGNPSMGGLQPDPDIRVDR